MHSHPFDISPISKHIWEDKYQLRGPDGAVIDETIGDSWQRIARAAASAERGEESVKARYEQLFLDAMSDFVFLPAGRILAGAGSQRDVTLFNCFVMGRIADDLGDIFDNVREAALTMQKGGGIGHDFSTLRPNGALVRSIGADASGPVSFMNVWDAMCRTIMSAGARRGAMMGTLRCDHPDIEAFIDAKADPTFLRNFNLSVIVPDDFIAAVRNDSEWELVFDGTIYRTIKARTLWQRLMQATYDYAEPGVIFIDRVNERNNLNYCETIFATNPCGEQPLPPYGACLLGSINLARLIDKPFKPGADIDLAALEEYARAAVRFLDNIIDVSHYPLKAQKLEAHAKRRMGLGVTGLADALIFCGLHYDSDAARQRAGQWMASIKNACYLASSELAAERGSFPMYDPERFMLSENVRNLDDSVRAAISSNGMRNGCLTSIAPTGTISLLAGNVSSGIEPVFAVDYQRRVLQKDHSMRQETVTDYAAALFRILRPGLPLPDTFVTSKDLSVDAHIKMQSTLQLHVDSSISKTINCPENISFEDFQDVYLKAFDMGLKGCTTFRPNVVTGAVLTGLKEEQAEFSDAPETKISNASDLARTSETRRDVIFLSEPLERAEVLSGKTYKLKWPGDAHAIYITINDIERYGRIRPFEIFVNTKNLEHQAWTVALTRMISAVFRRGGDVSFVVEELKAIFDPQGGQWLHGRYVPSLIAAIGQIIEQHMFKIGFLHEPQSGHSDTEAEPRRAADDRQKSVATGSSAASEILASNGLNAMSLSEKGGPTDRAGGRLCPRCGAGGLKRIEGCWACHECGYSHCG